MKAAIRWQIVWTCLAGLLLGCSGGGDDSISNAEELLKQIDRDRRRHDPEAFVEVDLGDFFITLPADEATTFTVRFQLYAVVDENARNELQDALKARDHRMRDAVLADVRKTSVEHLTESKLEWLKSELIPTVNRSLQTRAIRDVVFTAYAFERS